MKSTLTFIITFLLGVQLHAKPLKVFILAGQSNMEGHAKKYAAIRDAHYVPALYNRVGYVDITALIEEVAADLDVARKWKPGTLKNDGERAGSEKGFRD